VGFYERVVFSPICDRALDLPELHAERTRTLEPTRGTVLEVGIGTGLNLLDYPRTVHRITAVTRDRTLDVRAAERARARAIAVSHHSGDACLLPFQPAQFDTVVCTFILCSVSDPTAAAAEFARVLKPGGKLLFLEHVVGEHRGQRLAQRAWSPLARVLNCGCSPARDTARVLRDAPLRLDELTELDLPAMPWLYRRLIRGHATRVA
jgi:ubiquinone/menaquinone biosynthesis C-methylase UbiE